MLLVTIDDVPSESFVWMPAHTRPAHVGIKLLSNGATLTAADRYANHVAEKHAEDAALEFHASLESRTARFEHLEVFKKNAVRIAKVSHAANSQPCAPTRDSEASNRTAAALKFKRSRERIRLNATPVTMEPRPAHLGGHTLRLTGTLWRCGSCRATTLTWCKMARQRCKAPAGLRSDVKISKIQTQRAMYF